MFDDPNLVGSAGLVPVMGLARKAGLARRPPGSGSPGPRSPKSTSPRSPPNPRADQADGRLIVRRIPDFQADKHRAAGQDGLFDV